MHKRLFLLWFCFFILALSVQAQETPQQGSEILWDEWGVPHIFASDSLQFSYAFGWAQAQNHADLILRLYGESRARAAEYWGEDYLAQDMRYRRLELPQLGERIYQEMDSDFQQQMDAFAAGINDYAVQHPDLIDDAVEVVLPVTAQDVLAHGFRVLNYEFIARSGIGFAEGQVSDEPPSGSNGWAIAPSRTESGNAILLSNSHQPWYGFGRWTEFHMVLPDTNFYGVSLVGNPIGTMGFNDILGWTHTVNTHDGWDLYALELVDGETYVLDGEPQTFEMHEETIQVLDGEPVTVTVRRSVHGLVVAMDEENYEWAYALRLVCDETCNPWQQWWDMGQAKSFEEFESVMARLDIPIFTTIYADRDGNIMHLFNERIPIRETGDWAFWSNDHVLATGDPAVIAGNDSQYIWDSFHTYEELPRIVNPESGWVQNANEPPWTGTYPPLNPADYPTYFAPPPFAWPRPVQSIRMLLEMPEQVTFQDVVDMKFSKYAEVADWVLDDLLEAAREIDSPMVETAVEVLEQWDRTTNADSQGAILFTLWAVTYLTETGDAALALPWDYQNPLVERGLAYPEAAADALRLAAIQLNAQGFMLGIQLDSPYGDVFRLRVDNSDVDIPASGSYDVMGTFAILTMQPDTDGRFRPVHGDTYIAVVEFSDPIHAEVLLTHGNATQPYSPYQGDQLQMYANRELRPALRSRESIQPHLVENIVLQYQN